MDFIKIKDKDKKLYTIDNNENNEYLLHFLSNNNLIISTTKDVITFQVDSIKSLKKNNFLDTLHLLKFIYDLGSQILYLKDKNLGITYFSLSDLLMINDNTFVFINPNKLFPLLHNKDKGEGYGLRESVGDEGDNLDKLFMAPELKKSLSESIYYTCGFYSFAKILLYIFDLNIDKLFYTRVYFFLKRCLESIPEDRVFLYL